MTTAPRSAVPATMVRIWVPGDAAGAATRVVMAWQVRTRERRGAGDAACGRSGRCRQAAAPSRLGRGGERPRHAAAMRWPGTTTLDGARLPRNFSPGPPSREQGSRRLLRHQLTTQLRRERADRRLRRPCFGAGQAVQGIEHAPGVKDGAVLRAQRQQFSDREPGKPPPLGICAIYAVRTLHSRP